MSHVRQQIRERVATTLASSGSSAGSRVYSTRVVSLDETLLPAICVYTMRDEGAVEYEGSPRSYMRTLALVIEAYARVASDLDDALDSLCVSIEEALAADRFVNNLAFETEYLMTEILLTAIQGTDGGDRQIGVARLTYRVRYQVNETDVETIAT